MTSVRRWAFATVAATFTTVMIGGTLPAPLYPLYERAYGFGSATVTEIFAVYAVGTLGGLLVLGQASDHVGRRPMVLAALGVTALSTVLFLIATGTPLLYAGRLTSGLSVALATGAATAALAELEPSGNRRRAAAFVTGSTLGGLGLGSLMAGLLAEYGPHPTRLVFAVYLVLVATAVSAVIALVPETVEQRDRRIPLRPRFGLPPGGAGRFAPAGGAAFAAFGFQGLFTSLAASFLAETLHRPNHALAGAVVFVMFIAGAGSQLGLRDLEPRTAVWAGLGSVVAGLALVEVAMVSTLLAPFVLGAAVGGFGSGLTFMGSLGAVGRLAPADRRGAVYSTFYAVAYAGLIVPVIGLGLLTEHFTATQSTTGFAIGLCVVIAVVLGLSGGLVGGGDQATG